MVGGLLAKSFWTSSFSIKIKKKKCIVQCFIANAPPHYRPITFQCVIMSSGGENRMLQHNPIVCWNSRQLFSTCKRLNVDLMVHCYTMCHRLYGECSFVGLFGDDAVYCPCSGFPPHCGERSCREVFVPKDKTLPRCSQRRCLVWEH